MKHVGFEWREGLKLGCGSSREAPEFSHLSAESESRPVATRNTWTNDCYGNSETCVQLYINFHFLRDNSFLLKSKTRNFDIQSNQSQITIWAIN